jgi:hypothetical protein
MTQPLRPFVTMRWDVPVQVNTTLHVLSSTLRVPLRDLLNDALALLLRYHGDGHGIPAPPVRAVPLGVDEHRDIEVDEIEGSQS